MAKSKNPNNPKSAQPNLFFRFSSVALQMAVIITGGALGGRWLDDQFPNKYRGFTIVGSLTGIAISLYLVIKEVLSLNKSHE